MTKSLFTAKDVERCYPWISAWTVNNRVQKKMIPIEHASSGTGIPNMFTRREVVHCGVVDELACLGCFNNLNSTTVHYREPVGPDEKGAPRWKAWDRGLNAYYVDTDFYERHDYRVVIEVELRHDSIPGTNIPRELREGPGRFYVVRYAPEDDYNHTYIEGRLDYWLSPKKKKFNRLHVSKAFIRVRPIFDLAAEALGWKA